MDTVLVALLVMMVILYGVLTLTSGWLSSQRLATDAWADRDARAVERSAAGLRITEATAWQGQVTLTVENSGGARLADYAGWDLILHCYTSTGQYRIERIGHASAASNGEEWDVRGIYVDAARSRSEAYDLGILNPGEALVIDVTLQTPLDPDAVHLAVLNAANGVGSSHQFQAVP